MSSGAGYARSSLHVMTAMVHPSASKPAWCAVPSTPRAKPLTMPMPVSAGSNSVCALFPRLYVLLLWQPAACQCPDCPGETRFSEGWRSSPSLSGYVLSVWVIASISMKYQYILLTIEQKDDKKVYARALRRPSYLPLLPCHYPDIESTLQRMSLDIGKCPVRIRICVAHLYGTGQTRPHAATPPPMPVRSFLWVELLQYIYKYFIR